MFRHFVRFSYLRTVQNAEWPPVHLVRQQYLSLTPEHKSRFYFPLERLDQILDGTYKTERSWFSKWKAYLKQFHKLRIDQIRGMLQVCAGRRLMPRDLWQKLRTVHWTSLLSEAKGSDFASIMHSLALLNQSRQLKRGHVLSEPFMESVLKRALQRRDLHLFSSVALSQCLYSLALLDLRQHPLIAVYSAEICTPHRKETLTAQCLSNVLWSWAKLAYADASHITMLSEEVIRHSRKANAQELANIMWAWSALGHRSPDHWASVMGEIQKRRRQLTGQGMSLVFVACARIGYQDKGSCSALLQYVVERKKHVLYSHLILANLVWSLGKIQMPRECPFVIACVLESLKVSRLEKCTSQELCSVSLGVSKLDFRDLDLCIQLHKEVMKPMRLHQYNPQELCNLVWALGKMSVQNSECQKSLAAELVRRRDVLDQFPSQGLVSVVLGWAHSGFSEKEDSNVVLREVMKEDRLKLYNAQELANLCWSFGKLGIHSVNLYSRLTHHMLHERTICDFSPQALANILVGWAHGRFRDVSALDILTQRLKGEKLKALKPQELANVCWALGKLQCPSRDTVKRIALEACQREMLKSFTPLQMSMILLGWAKSSMHDFVLWDRVLAEFSSRQETIVMDMPILHNITQAVRLVGFKGLNDYRTAREKGRFVALSKT